MSGSPLTPAAGPAPVPAAGPAAGAAVTPAGEAAAAPGGRRRSGPARTLNRLDGLFQHGAWFLAPFLALYALFLIWPLLSGVWYSLNETNLAGIDTEFIGLDNYREAFDDPAVWDSLRNTVVFTALVTPMIVVTAFGLALLTHHLKYGTWFWRLAFFAPFLLPSAVVSDLWEWMYQPDFGLFNNALGTRVPWLLEGGWAMFSVALTTLWWTVGFAYLLYLAALHAIPAQLYEAAELDGAGPLKRLWYLTVPLVRSVTGLIVILTLLASLQVFDQIFLMTAGGPNNETRPVVQYIVQQGFTGYRIGYASAVSYIVFVLIVSVTLLRLLAVRKREEALR
ncbi:carbohydrate ABC transporter permease [Streptomyces aidingensis]|uniref:Multiple sugar transport system permease protein n=1 Tax=Streptomyces aidingensis TaxID=910347 RepID=A0A1I1FVP2_9ACTN|nr:sugar ABC transporter permease [Streptomyces aidingensis]SFC03395.1 multiple sugar transport system permease protein [Streptomyces aidingensis]